MLCNIWFNFHSPSSKAVSNNCDQMLSTPDILLFRVLVQQKASIASHQIIYCSFKAVINDVHAKDN